MTINKTRSYIKNASAQTNETHPSFCFNIRHMVEHQDKINIATLQSVVQRFNIPKRCKNNVYQYLFRPSSNASPRTT